MSATTAIILLQLLLFVFIFYENRQTNKKLIRLATVEYKRYLMLLKYLKDKFNTMNKSKADFETTRKKVMNEIRKQMEGNK